METVLEIFKELIFIGLAAVLVLVLGFAGFCYKHEKQSKDELHNKRS